MKRAALMLVLAACEANLHHTIDAQPLDTAVDTLSSEPGDPPTNAVKLTITRIGVPVADVAVFFQNADSSPVAASLTNANGVAWAVMPDGGFVTAREKTGAGVEALTTFAAVQASDALELELSPTGSTASVVLHLTIPTAPNAIGYQIHTPCGEPFMDADAGDVVLVGCGNATDLVIVPLDANGDALGALYAPSVSLDTGTATLTGTYDPLADVTLNYTNVPAFISFLGSYEGLSATRRAYSITAGAQPAAGAAQIAIKMPPTSGTELTATSFTPTPGEIGQQTLYNWHPAATDLDVDVGTVLLPPFATAPAFDPTAHTLSWTERAGDRMPEVVRGRIHVYRDAIPTGTAWTWRIVAPRSGTAIAYPKLPIVDFDFNPMASDTIGVDELTTISLPGGFAGFHTHGFAESRGAIAGTLGRIVEQTLYSEPL